MTVKEFTRLLQLFESHTVTQMSSEYETSRRKARKVKNKIRISLINAYKQALERESNDTSTLL